MIGVFDSGFGGLMIHRALTEALPQVDFVYLGDNRNAPYSTRPPIDVLTLACVGVEKLFALGCDLVIIADNTSSTVALRWIQQTWLPTQLPVDGTQRSVLGVVVPTVEAALAGKPASIGIFATERTVETETYPLEIAKRDAGVAVYQQACPDLVQLIEEGADEAQLRLAVHKYVGELYRTMGQAWPDSVILGCTHYPAAMDRFKEVIPPQVKIFGQRSATAAALKTYLAEHPQFRQGGTGQRQFLSTGFSPAALPQIARFWGEPLQFEII